MNTPSDGGHFLERAARWALVAAVAGHRGRALLGWGLGGPVAEKVFGFRLEEGLARYQRQQAAALQRKRALDALTSLCAQLDKLELHAERQPELPRPRPVELPPERPAPQPPLSEVAVTVPPAGQEKAFLAEPDARWRQVIVHPSVVLIVGRRDSGKSALGYRLLELLRHVAPPYVVGVPEAARKLLPDWIGLAPTLEEIPPKAVALVDEAYLLFHARSSMARAAKGMSEALNLSRQREQTWIFVTQEARQVDRNIVSAANVVAFKELGGLQLAFERAELSRLAAQARDAFTTVRGDKRRWTFVYASDRDFVGLLQNQLPSFWQARLSRVFAQGLPRARARAAKRLTPQEKAEQARELRARGLSYRAIARVLGVTPGTVVNYLKGYPYRRGLE